MSAEMLRRAAAEMRQDDQGPVMLALADLLDREAAMCEEFLIDEDETPDALAVARAYVGSHA